MKQEIVEQYNKFSNIYKLFGEECQRIIQLLLIDNDISIHQTTCRIKDKDKLIQKIETKRDKYTHLSDITDISGIRLITYFESDVDKIASIIEKEFKVDFDNSIDKRKLKSDQFGYKSLHYIISLGEERLSLTENKKYKDLKTEIQIRSILQHAWAEIEHDLGYKGEFSIPEEFKRTFNRIAAQLETADVEFDRLKHSLREYEQNVRMNITEKSIEIKLDQASLSTFNETNEIFIEARNIIEAITKSIFAKSTYYEFMLGLLNYLGIYTIKQLRELLEQNKKQYLVFISEFAKNVKDTSLPNTVSIYYFCHYIASKDENRDTIKTYLETNQISNKGEIIEKLINAIKISKY